MWTDFFVFLQPLPGESFRLRQCQKTPAVQESHSEDAVEALNKWMLPWASRINIVSANPMLQEPFLHLAGHKLTTVVTAQAIRLLLDRQQSHCHLRITDQSVLPELAY